MMPERPLDDIAASLSGELQRFFRPSAPGEPERAPVRIEPILQLLMSAAGRAQETARAKADTTARAADDGTVRRDLDQLSARVDALTQENRALERTVARLEGYVEGLRAQIASGGKRHKDD